MVSIKDVAKLAGVSKSTVSNVLNNSVIVSPRNIIKVQKAIKKLEYMPNATARSLKIKKSKNIGVILPNITDSNFYLIFTGIERVLSENGFTASLYTTFEIPNKENNIIDKIHQQRMDGTIIVTCQPQNVEVFKKLENSNLKIVFIEREIEGKEFNFIGFNNYRSIYDITNIYISRGYRRFCLVTGPGEYSSESLCINGYTDAFMGKDIDFEESLIRETNFDKESAFKTIMKVLRDEFIPEVIISSSTEIVKGILKAMSILKSKLKVNPVILTLGEYSWTGDYSSEIDFFTKVIKIQRESIKIGELAAEMLIDNIEKKIFHESKHILIDNLNKEDKVNFLDFKNQKKPQSCIKVLMMKSNACEATKSLLPDFEEKYGIKIEIDERSIIDLHDKIYAEVFESNYDVFQIDNPWFPELADGGYLLDLDNFIGKYPDSIEGFIPGVLDLYSKYKNNYYALPYMFGTQLLFYRKDIFEDLTIKSRFYELYHIELRPPKNWKEFNIIAKFFTKAYNPDSPTEYGTTLGAQFPTGAICEFLPRYWSYNNDFVNERSNILFDERVLKKALRNYTESFSYASPDSSDHFWDEEVEEFIKEKAAMMILFVAHATDITDRSKSKVVDKIGYEIIPGRTPMLGGWSLGINKKSDNKEDAFNFIKWATSQEIAIPYTIIGGFTPRINLFKSSELLNIYPWLPKALESFTLSRRRTISKVTTYGAISEMEYERILGKAVVDCVKKYNSVEKITKDIIDELKQFQIK
jgi:multiple sugar transport system substrate-binding protein